MGLESFPGLYIDGLDVNSPVGASDTKGEGDDHIRGIKLVLQNTFPNIAGIVNATQDELNYLDIATLGTVVASKALVADASANIDCGALTFTDLGTVTTADINGGTWQGTIDGNWTAAGQTCADLGTVSDADFTQLTLGGSAAMTAIETTIAGSATKLARADAIKTYVDAKVQTGLGAALSAGTMEVYVSSAIAYGGAGGLAAQSHGLSGIPQELTAVAECTSADGTYSSGDAVPVPFPWSDDSGYRGLQLWATSTQVDGYVAAEGIKIMNKAASTLMTLTAAKWNIYIVAKYYT